MAENRPTQTDLPLGDETAMPNDAMTAHEEARTDERKTGDSHWHRNLRITGSLLAVWFVFTFVAAYFARDLSFSFFGWPFSFWLASQGSLVIFLAIVWWYARRLDRLDREYGIAEDQ